MIIMYVDDMVLIGNKEIIEELKTKWKKCFPSKLKII